MIMFPNAPPSIAACTTDCCVIPATCPIGERIGTRTVASPLSEMMKKFPMWAISYMISAVSTPDALLSIWQAA